MTAFKAGDRVRVYQVGVGSSFAGTVVAVDRHILFVDGSPFHVKQCRRLVKQKRRRGWINADLQGERSFDFGEVWESIQPGEHIEFIEVRKPKGNKP